MSVDFKRAQDESADAFENSGDCPECGHANVLHNWHCCEYCPVCERRSESKSDEYPCARYSDSRNG
jgi:hypothetical protein